MDFRNSSGSLGLRNNNVGNLKPSGFTYVGQVGVDKIGHAIFSDMKYGVRALVMDLSTKFYNRTPLLDTFKKFVSVFAPTKDGNNEAAYVDWLVKNTGIGANEKIPKDINKFKQIFTAVGKYEITVKDFNKIPQEDINFGYSQILPKYFGKDAINATGSGSSGLFKVFLPLLLIGSFFLLKNKFGKSK